MAKPGSKTVPRRPTTAVPRQQPVSSKGSSSGGESISGSSRFVVNDPAVAGIHATVLAALANRIRIR